LVGVGVTEAWKVTPATPIAAAASSHRLEKFRGDSGALSSGAGKSRASSDRFPRPGAAVAWRSVFPGVLPLLNAIERLQAKAPAGGKAVH
jgi:hypothetical protein